MDSGLVVGPPLGGDIAKAENKETLQIILGHANGENEPGSARFGTHSTTVQKLRATPGILLSVVAKPSFPSAKARTRSFGTGRFAVGDDVLDVLTRT